MSVQATLLASVSAHGDDDGDQREAALYWESFPASPGRMRGAGRFAVVGGAGNAAALYEAPFSNLHAGGPEALFAGKETVITGIFDALDSSKPQILVKTG